MLHLSSRTIYGRIGDKMPFCRLYYHIMWCTENRQPMLVDEARSEIYRSITAKVTSLGGTVYGIGGIEDHVHLACSIPPTVSLSKFVGEVKGSSSFHAGHNDNGNIPLDWQRGYGVISFRKSDLDQVLNYIRNQQGHHSQGKVWQTLEDCGEEDSQKPNMVREEHAEYDPYA